MARDLTANEKEAVELLKSLRSSEDAANYKKVWNQIVKCLGSDQTVSDTDIIIGMLITLVTRRFGFDYHRDITLIALGLMADYDTLKITRRRQKYIKEQGHRFIVFQDEESKKTDKLTADAIRKREDNYFRDVIIELSDGIKEKGESYLDELFETGEKTYVVYFSSYMNAWVSNLPRIGDTNAEKFTSIWKFKHDITTTEERVIDELHQRILDGEKVINTGSLLGTSTSYVGSLYYQKYKASYGAMLGVNVSMFSGKRHIKLQICKMIDDEELSIMIPADWEELKLLADTIKNPLFNYTYESDGTPDDKQILLYLEQKGVVFAPSWKY